MRAEDREPVLDLLESAFDLREEFERYMDFDPLFSYEDFLLHVEDGRPTSCVQVFEKQLRLRATRVKLGGIGSVATAPDARNRGLATELMRAQTRVMRDRGMSLGLLFAGPIAFYEKLGWHARPLRQFALRRAPTAKGEPGRAFEASDLPRVMELYDRYCEGRDGTTLRSEEYWQGNLRYAEAPGHQFRLRESAGELSAYVRTGRLAGFDCLMEFAARPGCELELAALVVGRVPDGGALIARLPRDSALEGALAEGGLEFVELADRSPMWLVLDRARLASLAGVPPDVGDAELLAKLGLHYWLADRF